MSFASRPEDMPTPAEMARMSGLEAMRAILEGRLPEAPIARGMAFRPETVEEGRVVFRGTPSFDHTNPMGSVHGGWYGTLLDSAMACAVLTRLPAGVA